MALVRVRREHTRLRCRDPLPGDVWPFIRFFHRGNRRGLSDFPAVVSCQLRMCLDPDRRLHLHKLTRPAKLMPPSIRQSRIMSDLGESARGLLLIILAVYLVPNHRKRCRRTFIDRVASPGKSD